jgi:hypothetical protein
VILYLSLKNEYPVFRVFRQMNCATIAQPRQNALRFHNCCYKAFSQLCAFCSPDRRRESANLCYGDVTPAMSPTLGPARVRLQPNE